MNKLLLGVEIADWKQFQAEHKDLVKTIGYCETCVSYDEDTYICGSVRDTQPPKYGCIHWSSKNNVV